MLEYIYKEKEDYESAEFEDPSRSASENHIAEHMIETYKFDDDYLEK